VSTAGLRPVAGEGVLTRHGALVVLCAANADNADLVEAVLAAHEDVAHSGGDGNALADRLEAVLGDASGDLGVVAFGPAGGSLAVAVFGHAWADVTTEHGEQRLALRQSHSGVRSVLPGTLLSVRAGLGAVDVSTEPQRWGNLEHGSVHAGGLLFMLAEAPPSAAPQAAAPEPPTTALPAQQDPSGPVTEEVPVQRPRRHAAAETATGPTPSPPIPAQPATEPAGDTGAAVPPDMPVVAPPEVDVDRGQPFSSVVLVSAASEDTPAAAAPLPIATPPRPVAPEVAPAPPVEEAPWPWPPSPPAPPRPT